MIPVARDRLLAHEQLAQVRDDLAEAELVRAARRDPECFAPLYQRYAPRIFAYCASRMNSQEAEDLTSQIFASALSGLDGYRGGSVAAWLFRIARNAVASYYRHDRRHRTSVSLDALGAEFPDRGMTAFERVAQADLWRAVCGQVAALSRDDRELLVLWLDGELSAEEIGLIIGKKAGTVRVKLHRILKRLRERCAEVPA